MYRDMLGRMPTSAPRAPIERIQTGVRLEKRLLKVTKALADSLDRRARLGRRHASKHITVHMYLVNDRPGRPAIGG